MLKEVARLQQSIEEGEGSRFACRLVRVAAGRVVEPRRDNLADDLAAFANGAGGVLVMGVRPDSPEVEGIPLDGLDLVQQLVTEAALDVVTPPVFPIIEKTLLMHIDGEFRPVIRIEVRPSFFVHASPGGYLRRTGSVTEPIPSEGLTRLLRERAQGERAPFEASVVEDASIGDLDPLLIDRLQTRQNAGDRRALLRDLGMAREDDGGELRPTVAGVLLGARHPERWLKHAFIQAVAYRGESVLGVEHERGYQLDARDITGPLDAQVAEACRFVARNMPVGATKTIGRHDVPQYDLTAVFEALVNAVAHRDYSMYGSKIRLRMFANRLELYSPGALLGTMTLNSLEWRQSSRNQTITSLLAKCPVPNEIPDLTTPRSTLTDRRGEGVSVILERSERLSGKPPVYDLLDDAELKLTIFAADPAAMPSDRKVMRCERPRR